MSRHLIIKLTQKKGPMSAKQLADEVGINESSMRTCIRRARAHGTKHIRIAAWAGNVALYGPGPEPDTEDMTTVGQIRDYLEIQGAGTNAQIAKHTSMSMMAVDAATRRLHQAGVIYVSAWKRRIGMRGGRMAAVFSLGRFYDTPKPDVSEAQAEAELRRGAKRRVASALRTGRKLRGPMRRSTTAIGEFE